MTIVALATILVAAMYNIIASGFFGVLERARR
jgi:hypothetical protein